MPIHSIQSTILSDSYKQGHYDMYPEDLTLLYSNFTPRKSRIEGVNAVIFFGLQYFLKEFLIDRFNESFFDKPKDEALRIHKSFVAPFSTGEVTLKQWGSLHDLGYLPILIKALPEGTACPIGVPMLTIRNTHPEFAWLVNFIETILSTVLWLPITSATTAKRYRDIAEKWCEKTGGDPNFIDWQCHDFSMRGMASLDAACASGAAHLTSFKGSDTIPAVPFLKEYYGATGLIAGSVGATEHSVMSTGGQEDEIETFERLLNKYPSGIISIVSDTWDLWKVCTEYLPTLKDKILNRDGKCVVRPDSGLPEDILCGTSSVMPEKLSYRLPKEKGVVELLWDTFGGTINEKGFKVLNPCIGTIYGDSITPERAETIFRRLEEKGFCSTNVVLGIGSYTYNYVTRDTFGMAMKATYCERAGVGKNIFKNPVTDSGEKKSAKGLLCVVKNIETSILSLLQEVDKSVEAIGELQTVFKDSEIVKMFTLEEIRALVKIQKID